MLCDVIICCFVKVDFSVWQVVKTDLQKTERQLPHWTSWGAQIARRMLDKPLKQDSASMFIRREQLQRRRQENTLD